MDQSHLAVRNGPQVRSRFDLSTPTTATAMESISSSSENPSEAVVLSKKAQKRALKMARLEERKIERRAKEKAAKKEKKRKRVERVAAGEQLSEDEVTEKRAKMNQAKKPFSARVVLDLGFDDKMNDKVRHVFYIMHHVSTTSWPSQEITSLCSQLAYVYSVNRRSPNPFRSLLFTSLNGRTLSRLEKLNNAGYRRWTGTEWWTESYERLWEQSSEESAAEEGNSSGETPTEENDNGSGSNPEQLLATPVSRDRVVYLTADSNEVIDELKEGVTYVIGGICDHNRYKVRKRYQQRKYFMDVSAEPLFRQGQRVGSPCRAASYWAISITLTNKKGPHREPGFRGSH
jgi:tRNA (guanine9-N1)-methyltransferase